MSGRASKQKGSRNERGLVKLLIDAGFAAERSPLSGALPHKKFGGGCDVTVAMFGREHRIEAKHHANGFARLYKWLTGVDLLIVRADRSEPLVIMPLSRLIEIAKGATGVSDAPSERCISELRDTVCKTLCQSGRFETGEGTCALICLDQLGDARKNCRHRIDIHSNLADLIIGEIDK